MAQRLSIADLPEWASSVEAVGEFYLFGSVPFAIMTDWQRRMAWHIGQSSRLRIAVAFCVHEPLITVGRRGSRRHILMTGEQLRHHHLEVQWVARGGGCILHGPGQLAVYTLVPIERFGWSAGTLLGRLRQATLRAFHSLSIHAQAGQEDFGVWGRSGQLASMGIAVRQGISQYGLYINVNPPMDNYRFVLTASEHRGWGGVLNRMGCLMAERRQGITLPQLRSALVESLAPVLQCSTYHVYSSHPWLSDLLKERGT